jgi:CheY-like chemotaxis protein
MFPERVLVVDDDPLVPSIMRAHFLSSGASTCDMASNGQHALDLFCANPAGYDLVVCDISMPQMDGIELISALHHQGYAGWLGVITSQHPTLGRTALNIAESYGMRVAGVGRKPLDRQTLDKFLNRARKGHARVRPAGGQFSQMTVDELRKPRWTKTGWCRFTNPSLNSTPAASQGPRHLPASGLKMGRSSHPSPSSNLQSTKDCSNRSREACFRLCCVTSSASTPFIQT